MVLAVYGQTMNDSTRLIQDLLNGYDKMVRPIADQSQPVIFCCCYNLYHMDRSRMMWNPLNYNGLYTITIPVTNLWTPTLVVGNSFDKIEPIGGDWMTARYYANGVSVYSPGNVFQTTCSVDVTYYPFDTQSCKVMLIPVGSLPSEIKIFSSSDTILKSFFSENGEWEVISTSVAVAETDIFALIQFNIKMKRRPTFFLVNRISFAITVLLAIAVFLTLVGDNLPKTSKPMSLICYLLLVNLSLSTFICIITILNLRLYHKPESKPVPRLLAAIARKLNCMNPINEISNTEKENLSFTMKKEPNQMSTSKEEIATVVDWKDISRMVDKVMCVFSLLWIFISSTSFIAIIAEK
ncbi:hypothetical protein ACJMK2_021034 [Sinanodonta woodiana]|uniref:Uncharacterized protein n=1 Tax=Sinanodonta woodiana TaxID=1069815 RepID=A0ABD3U115_SINWO